MSQALSTQQFNFPEETQIQIIMTYLDVTGVVEFIQISGVGV